MSPAPNSRRNTSQRMMKMVTMGGGHPAGAEEYGEEARFQEEGLPPEAVEDLAHVHDREVEGPQEEPHQHGQPWRSEVGPPGELGGGQRPAQPGSQVEGPV